MRTTEMLQDAKAQLTAAQREKLRSLWMARCQRRGSGEGGAEESTASEEDESAPAAGVSSS